MSTSALSRPGGSWALGGLTDRQGALTVLREAVLSAYVEQRVDEFLDALHRVVDGGTAFGPEAVAQLLARNRPDNALDQLSPRETDVLALMAEGLGNVVIAERLVITEGAVHKHIRNIFAKLGMAPDDRADRRVAAVLRYLDSQGK